MRVLMFTFAVNAIALLLMCSGCTYYEMHSLEIQNNTPYPILINVEIPGKLIKPGVGVVPSNEAYYGMIPPHCKWTRGDDDSVLLAKIPPSANRGELLVKYKRLSYTEENPYKCEWNEVYYLRAYDYVISFDLRDAISISARTLTGEVLRPHQKDGIHLYEISK